MRDESVTVIIESFLRRQVQCPALSRPSEMAGFLEFKCSEKGMLVRPKTIRQSGPQLRALMFQIRSGLASIVRHGNLCEDMKMLCLVRPATTGNTGQENQGGWLQRASTGKKRLQFARKLVATEDFRARQTDKGRLESQDGYQSGGHSRGKSSSHMK